MRIGEFRWFETVINKSVSIRLCCVIRLETSESYTAFQLFVFILYFAYDRQLIAYSLVN